MHKPDGENKAKCLARFGWYELPEENSLVRFCQDSGLHGIKYITGPNQHLCERLFWLVAFITATFAGSYLIYNTWDQYYNLPVVYVQSQKQYSIDQIPFPSVTVCGLNRVTKETYEKYYALSTNDNARVQEGKDALKVIENLCGSSNIFLNSMSTKYRKMYDMGYQSAFLNLELSQNLLNESKIMKLINESSQNCEDLILEIHFELDHDVTTLLVEKVETDFGFCCTFNTIPTMKLKPWKNMMDWDRSVQTFYENNPKFYKDVSMDTLMRTDDSKESILPRTQVSPGLTHGLSIVLQAKVNDFYCTDSNLNAFIVSITHPLDAPSTKKLIYIEFNQEVFFTLKPKITIGDNSIERFTPEQRGCYFGNEYPLRDHSVYTKSNCLQECIANLTMKHCQGVADCWKFAGSYLGFETDWIYGHICQPKEKCDNETSLRDVPFSGADESCKHCLPTCNDIKYEYIKEVKQLENNLEHISQNRKRKLELELDEPGNTSVVHVYFDEYYATPTIRKEQSGIFDLLADSGGLLGLCLGFSGLSILEIIYYFTIRVCFGRFRQNVLLKNGLCLDVTANPNDNANQIHYLHMIQAENEKTIKQLQESVSTLKQIVLNPKDNPS